MSMTRRTFLKGLVAATALLQLNPREALGVLTEAEKYDQAVFFVPPRLYEKYHDMLLPYQRFKDVRYMSYEHVLFRGEPIIPHSRLFGLYHMKDGVAQGQAEDHKLMMSRFDAIMNRKKRGPRQGYHVGVVPK